MDLLVIAFILIVKGEAILISVKRSYKVRKIASLKLFFLGRKERALAAHRASMPQLPSFNDPRAVHRFFLDQISAGESALAIGNIDEAVTHFAYAIVVCGQPTHLLQVLQSSLSPSIFSKVVGALPEVRQVN